MLLKLVGDDVVVAYDDNQIMKCFVALMMQLHYLHIYYNSSFWTKL